MVGAIIICIVIPIIFGIIIAILGGDFEEVIEAISCVGIILVLIYGGTSILVLGITNAKYEVTAIYEEKQYKISGLENKTENKFELNGHYVKGFIIGQGYINAETKNEMNYYYFKENEYGKILESIPCKDTYIREKDDEIPCLIYVVEERKYKNYPILSKIFLGVRKEPKYEGIVIEKILQVPLNTIQIEYNVDI